jgi:hypothetical protein
MPANGKLYKNKIPTKNIDKKKKLQAIGRIPYAGATQTLLIKVK